MGANEGEIAMGFATKEECVYPDQLCEAFASRIAQRREKAKEKKESIMEKYVELQFMDPWIKL